MKQPDWLLGLWLLLSFAWDVAVVGTTAYVVFWRGRSAWWFVLACIFTYSPTLFKALAKRYEIPNDEE